MIDSKKNWYVVYTRPRWEKKVATLLDANGTIYYCPLNKVEKKWIDRKKIVFEPLFKGYVFVQLSAQQKWEVKNVDGIINFVYWLGKPAVVKQEDIDRIKKFLMEFDDVKVENRNLEPKTIVTITHGSFMDYEGMIIEVLNNKARVQIDGLGVQLTAILKKEHLQILKKNIS